MATFSDLVVTRWGARFMGRQMRCATGRGGVGHKLREGDGITPLGQFRIIKVYARTDRIGARASPIHPLDIWPDDPADAAYNTPKRQHRYPFRHERLWRADPLYDLVADLDFNRCPPEPGKGSAIFLHVWRSPRYPTQGCVAFAAKDLKWILSRWRPESRVIIR